MLCWFTPFINRFEATGEFPNSMRGFFVIGFPGVVKFSPSSTSCFIFSSSFSKSCANRSRFFSEMFTFLPERVVKPLKFAVDWAKLASFRARLEDVAGFDEMRVRGTADDDREVPGVAGKLLEF